MSTSSGKKRSTGSKKKTSAKKSSGSKNRYIEERPVESKSKREKKRRTRNKVIAVVVAIFLILLIGGISYGGKLYHDYKNGEQMGWNKFMAMFYPEKYSYSTDTANLNEYFQILKTDDVAIILQDTILKEDRGKFKNGRVYFSLDTIKDLFTNRFYVSADEKSLLYSTSKEVRKVLIGEESNTVTENGAPVAYDYMVAYKDASDGMIYVAADYVKKYANFSYAYYEDPHRVQVYTEWLPYNAVELKMDTAVRYQGGIKSEVLTNVKKGDTVRLLERMENWSKVKTVDGFIGYVENETLLEAVETTDPAVTDAYNPRMDYALTGPLDKKVVLGWHQIYSADDGTNLKEVTQNVTGMNVVSPTWWYLTGGDGSYKSYANYYYVTYAHDHGYQVWPLIEDMTFENDEYTLFSDETLRASFIDKLVSDCIQYKVDGLNVDFERIGKETGPHYVQFLRELSIKMHENGLILSVDNYPMNQGNLYYNLGEQGLVCDYVINMGYDEHWAGSAAGSVASAPFVEKGISDAINAGVPAGKLINAVPFYTRVWKTDGATVTSEAVSMNTAAEWIANHGINVTWDEECQQYYGETTIGNNFCQIWQEEVKSMEVKLSIMQQYGVGGVAGWRLGLDNAAVWNVIASYMQ
ncbi:MAG: glycosyl hydrolase family 18 protein [Lachnospiraceae bacterium]|nr:glycosyl hydrolase family 18 protein [Lachnospiraceae bacterium]